MTELEITKHFFDKRAEIWDSHDCMQKGQRLHTIFKEEVPTIEYPLLDMGSGTGVLIPVLEKLVQKPGYIVEFDISREMIKKSWIKYHSKEFVNFIQSDGHFLPFQNETFAAIICFAVYPHFYDHVKTVKEMNRVLIKDGLLVILHLMGHQQLNSMHEEADKAVCHHALQPINIVTEQITAESFKILNCKEQEDLYLIVAQK